MPIAKAYIRECEEAIKFIRDYELTVERIQTKFKVHEIAQLAKYLGFKTGKLNEEAMATLIHKAVN